jgi:hypothetical protein
MKQSANHHWSTKERTISGIINTIEIMKNSIMSPKLGFTKLCNLIFKRKTKNITNHMKSRKIQIRISVRIHKKKQDLLFAKILNKYSQLIFP